MTSETGSYIGDAVAAEIRRTEVAPLEARIERLLQRVTALRVERERCRQQPDVIEQAQFSALFDALFDAHDAVLAERSPEQEHELMARLALAVAERDQ